jgi:Flp pilus assembly protein TadD
MRPHARCATILALAALPLLSTKAAADPPSQTWSTSRASELTRQGDAHAARGDAASATKRFLEAITFDPSYGPSYIGLAAVYQSLGDVVEAERVYTLGLTHVAGFTEAYLGRARLRQRLGRMREAALDFEHARPLAPDDPSLLRDLCAAYITLGALPAALAASRRLEALAQAQGDAPALKEARVRSRALSALVAEADPVTSAGADRGRVREALAVFARQRR